MGCGNYGKTLRQLLQAVLLAGWLASGLADGLVSCPAGWRAAGQALAAAGKEPVKIGVFGPLSGSIAIAGIHQKDGAQFAADEINAAGGAAGHRLELLFADTEGVPANTTNIMNKFLYRDRVHVTVGSPNSPEVLAVLDLIRRAETPHVVPSGVAMAITHSGNPWVFRIVATDEVFSKKLVDYAVDTAGLKKLAIIYDTSDYGQGGMELVRKYLEQKGLRPVAVEGYNRNARDFTSQLLKFKNAGAEAVIIWGLYTEGAQIVRQIRSLGLDVQVLASTGVTIGNFYELAGDAAEGLIGVAPGYHPGRKDPVATSFAQRYRARMQYDPDLNVVLAYDAIKVIARAVELAGSPDKVKIRDALRSIRDFPGIGGRVSFRENGDGGTEALLFQVKGGKPVLLQ